MKRNKSFERIVRKIISRPSFVYWQDNRGIIHAEGRSPDMKTECGKLMDNTIYSTIDGSYPVTCAQCKLIHIQLLSVR